jgi:sulfite reductase alpha subunit-like flavoprotein
MAYAPCIEHGLRTGMAKMIQEAESAIDCGYWPLYRFDPRLAEAGNNPFQLDSKRIKGEVLEFLKRENRFINLDKNNPTEAASLRTRLDEHVKARFNKYKRLMDSHKPTLSSPTGPKVTILYGSETGNSEGLAKELGTDFERRDYSVSVQALDDIDPMELPDLGFVVIAISTCGQGVFPRNSMLFWQELQKDKPEGWLKDLQYCVFGLGDSTYYFYCHTAKLIDARLAELGGQRLVPLGTGDDGDEDHFETGFNNWIPSVWSTLGTKTPESRLFDPVVSVQFTPQAHPEEWHWKDSTPVNTSTGAVRITPETHSRNFVTIVWKTDLPYRIGDSLGLYPANNLPEVEEFLRWYGLNPSDIITLENRGSRVLPEIISVGDLFAKVLDLLGKPSRRFYQHLVHFATNPEEREALLLMGQGEGEFSNVLGETLHYADILKKYTSAKPPLQFLIELIPNIKPRYYSISSSPKHTPGEVHSLVLIDTWMTASGRHRTGLTCSLLEKIQAGQSMDGCIHPTAMEFPDDEKPLVMAGIGSGLAPFVAFCRERSFKRKQGIKVGNLALFFGNRHKDSEFLMEKELQEFVDEGLLTLFTAFSRDDPKKKVYVQDIVRSDPELVHRYLVKDQGSMYVCGSREMPKPVQNSLKFCFMENGMSEKEADDWIVGMFTSGRYNIESW